MAVIKIINLLNNFDNKKKDKNLVFHFKNFKNLNLHEIHTLLKVLELKDFFVFSYVIEFLQSSDKICYKETNLFINDNILVSQHYV